MAIKLNATPEAYKEFYGSNVEQMPKLIADGRVPMNVSQLMQRRLDVRNSDKSIKGSYMDNYFDTGDAVVYHPDGRVKIVFDSQTLREITPESQRNSGALVLTEDAYNALQGEEFKKGKLGKVNDGLSRADVKAHPVWKVLARDQALLNDYTDFIFGEYQPRFAKDSAFDDLKLMGIYPSSAQGKTPEMRAWIVGGLVGRSGARGRYVLDVDYGRFVGIAPEAQSSFGNGTSNVRAYTMADVQIAKKQRD
ncbi:MAG: hypothetical protein KKA64_03890, partial [Nanoarchaeota archaeon]|nr:hypothetical protein [Nanoarchaeota archaeon]